MLAKDKLKQYLIDVGFREDTARLIVAQAAHETGGFTSSVFRIYNNPFGMKHPSIRKTTSLKAVTALKYASYSDLQSAAQDFRYWWLARNMPERFVSIPEYVTTLKNKGYFEDSYDNYLRGVTSFYNNYQA